MHTTFGHRPCDIFVWPGRAMQRMRQGLDNQKLASALNLNIGQKRDYRERHSSMRKPLAPDTSLDIDQYELKIKGQEGSKHKKITDYPISHQIPTFDSHLLKNIQHLLSEHLM